MRGEFWSDSELQLLYDVVNDPDWFAKVRPFLGRTPKAIRRRMCQLRDEAGIILAHPAPRASSERATTEARLRHANQRFLGNLARPASGHIPFAGHRTQQEVMRDEAGIVRNVLSAAFPVEQRKAIPFTPPKPERVWCGQCERLVKCQEAGMCLSEWCKAKELAA